MPVVAAIAAAVGIGGGVLAADQKRTAYQEAGDAQKDAIGEMIARLDAVGMPPDQSAAVILNQYKQAGIYTPQLEQQVKDSISAYSQIKGNQTAHDTQVKALQQMSQYGKAGLTADERAASRLAQSDVQRQNEANQQSIIQSMQQRGQAGSGAELAARMGAQQGTANSASEQADRISATAAQRALQAISQSSTMAGQLQQQDFSQAAQKAAAADEMNRFNVQNQMAIGQRNTGYNNAAQAANLENLQNINNSNTSQNNQEKYNQLARQRQFWQDKLNYAQAYMSPLQQYGNAAAAQNMGEDMARSEGTSKAFGALSGAIGSMGAGGGGAAGGMGGVKSGG